MTGFPGKSTATVVKHTFISNQTTNNMADCLLDWGETKSQIPRVQQPNLRPMSKLKDQVEPSTQNGSMGTSGCAIRTRTFCIDIDPATIARV